ncbi:MAG: acyl-CoA dehydrogenase family protein [Fimbriimonadaceae bacterium]
MAVAPLTSSGGSFFSVAPDSIFSPESFGSDEKLMISEAEKFSRNEILTQVEALDHQEDGLMPKLVRKAGEIGFCGVDAPAEYGGLGMGKNLSARILEYLSLNASFSVTFGVTSGISVFGLIAFGTEEQKRQYLPKLTSGEWIGAYALSEPNSGSDALSATTRAELKNGKWVLNGTKMWISNAKWADFFLVMAKIDGEKFSAFIVEKSHPGVSISREEHKMGLKGSSTARLVLEDAQIPEENLLYEPGLGHHVAFNALNIGRFKLAAMSMGPARNAMELGATYSQDRKQFGRSIGEFGLIRKKFAESAARFFAAESAIYRTGALIDEAFDSYAHDMPGMRRAAEEYAMECSACKVLATEAEAVIVDEMLQCYGGYGFTEEFPIARHYRDARVSKIYEGTNEINRVFLADRLRRRAQEGRCSLVSAGDSFISDLAGKAMQHEPKGQVQLGSQSDLVMLSYAEQSARIRAKQVGGVAIDLHHAFVNWANIEAARAFAIVTDTSAGHIPHPHPIDLDSLGYQTLQKGGPLL